MNENKIYREKFLTNFIVEENKYTYIFGTNKHGKLTKIIKCPHIFFH